jgi:hypothetical protein
LRIRRAKASLRPAIFLEHPFWTGLVRAAVLEEDSGSLFRMPVREQEIDALARHFVETMKSGGAIVPKAELDALIACVVEFMSDNFEQENEIDEEADRMAEDEARKNPGIDVTRLRNLIRQKIAQRKGFTL